MRFNYVNSVFRVLFFMLLLAFFQNVKAARYEFSLGGFSGKVISADGAVLQTYQGGQILGSFEGQDSNADGLITQSNGTNEFFPDEAELNFSIHYAGNPIFATFSLVNPEDMLLKYDIKTNALSFNSVSDLGFSYDHANAITGLNYSLLYFFGGVTLDSSKQKTGTLGGTLVYGEGSDQDGLFFGDENYPLKGIRSFSFSSNEQIKVTPISKVSQVPLPGAFVLFITGMTWLGAFCRKQKSCS